MNTSLVSPDIHLDNFYENEDIVWDFENNACLFPLYLFKLFSTKDANNKDIKHEQSSYYSRKSVYCKCNDSFLEEKYQAWFIVTTRFEHVGFYLQIGKDGFVPFLNKLEYPKNLLAYLHLQVFSNKIKLSVNIGTCPDLNVLFLTNKVAEVVSNEMKKHNLFTETY